MLDFRARLMKFGSFEKTQSFIVGCSTWPDWLWVRRPFTQVDELDQTRPGVIDWLPHVDTYCIGMCLHIKPGFAYAP